MFTTIQKFFPEENVGTRYPTLSERRNIVVIADEAHRSQYDFIDGYARHIRDALPNASFIGFTGTPIEVHGRQYSRCVRRLHQCLRHQATRWKTRPPCGSTTRAGWPISTLGRTLPSPRLILILRKSLKVRRVEKNGDD